MLLEGTGNDRLIPSLTPGAGVSGREPSNIVSLARPHHKTAPFVEELLLRKNAMAVVGKTGMGCDTSGLKTELVIVSRSGAKRSYCETVVAGTETDEGIVTVAV